MTTKNRCWAIDDYELRPLDPRALRDYRSCVSLHVHSSHSTENIASLNWVTKLWYMRPLAPILQWAFGLARGEDLDYRQVTYHPPFGPEDVLAIERGKAASLGFSTLVLGLTDHDEIGGGLELLARHPEMAPRLPVGVELSLPYAGHLFHLGVTGLPPLTAREEHAQLQASSRSGDVEAVFARLRRLGCLVVLNHPLLPWGNGPEPAGIVRSLLSRHGEAVDALEFNGMRTIGENTRVLELARSVGKPVVGGGDSHLMMASAATCASNADTFADFVEEVRSGRSRPILTEDFFSPLTWKIALRVLSFMAQYRAIAHFRGEPVARLLAGRRVALDPVGFAAGWFLKAASRLGRVS